MEYKEMDGLWDDEIDIFIENKLEELEIRNKTDISFREAILKNVKEDE